MYRLQFFFRGQYIEQYVKHASGDTMSDLLAKNINDSDFIKAEIDRVFFEEISDYGDMYTMDQFRSMVEADGFINYAGRGHLASEDECSNVVIKPSDLDTQAIPEWATHVVWYNR